MVSFFFFWGFCLTESWKVTILLSSCTNVCGEVVSLPLKNKDHVWSLELNKIDCRGQWQTGLRRGWGFVLSENLHVDLISFRSKLLQRERDNVTHVDQVWHSISLKGYQERFIEGHPLKRHPTKRGQWDSLVIYLHVSSADSEPCTTVAWESRI